MPGIRTPRWCGARDWRLAQVPEPEPGGGYPGQLAEPGVHPLVDLGADPLDLALGHGTVVVPAEFGVHGRGGGNIVTR